MVSIFFALTSLAAAYIWVYVGRNISEVGDFPQLFTVKYPADLDSN